ncbi:hypothetical protein OIU85_003824 [Salix viminalis]|uniref:Uncharacterized protein n=1 Tax=Salix viminalis TaxID=40686 RepID=A0A9Q0T1R5_SALVM|nr:hypothetical protein OIU85_003824 [Salix viminalis]
MGTEAIQGMAINLMKVNDMSMDENVFCNLQNLRLLQLNHICDTATSDRSRILRLTTLSLRDCNLSDDALPRDLGSLRSLKNLELDRNSFQSLPASLSNLLRLQILRLDDNERIQTIPDLPRNLDVLRASNCTSLERLPDISVASRMRLLYVANCPKLIEAPGLDTSKSISHIDMEGILRGINVCIVCSSHLEKEETKHIRINLTNHTKGFTKSFRAVAINLVKSCEDHLWQGHLSNKVFKLGSEDEVELIVDCRNTMIVKKTGVYLVFEQDVAVSSCDNLPQTKRMRFETSQQNIEENMDVA